MGGKCSTSVAKIFLFIFNFIFFLSGGALLAIGILFKVDRTVLNFLRIVNMGETSYMELSSWVLIGVGGFIFVVSFLGCCGACCESVCCLCLYALLLFFVMVAEFGAGILAAIYKGKVQEILLLSMKKQIRELYDKDKSNPFTVAWDFAQVELNCCGAEGPKDYFNSRYYNESRYGNVPPSCCVLKNKDPQNPIPKDVDKCQQQANGFIKKEGCYDALLAWVKLNAGLLIGIGCGIASIQVLCFTLACCLRSCIRDRDEKMFDEL